ncbi:MAG: hypothetical protein MIO92_01505 [Methanosarcinaceae archaeon]|nr:hypothetical protein [Methanosarcinaceae archaeon]
MAQQHYKSLFKKARSQFITESDPFLAMLKWVMTEMMRTKAEAKIGAAKGNRSQERSLAFYDFPEVNKKRISPTNGQGRRIMEIRRRSRAACVFRSVESYANDPDKPGRFRPLSLFGVIARFLACHMMLA